LRKVTGQRKAGNLEFWSGQVDLSCGPRGLGQLSDHGVATVTIGFVVKHEIADLDVAAGAVYARIAEQYGEIERLRYEPVVYAGEHGLYIAAAAVIRMHAHFGDSADPEPASLGFHVFVMHTDVRDDGPPLVSYDPAMPVRFAKIPPFPEDCILRLREAPRQQRSDFCIQRGIHGRIREIFDCYFLVHVLPCTSNEMVRDFAPYMGSCAVRTPNVPRGPGICKNQDGHFFL